MEIKFKKLDPRAVAPVRAHNTDAGFDLTATRITTEINECGQLILVYHTDLAFEIPDGYFGMIVPRSSIFKKSLVLTNHAGVVDSNYRGEVSAKFRNTTDVVPAVYKEGERFAQLLILPVPEVTFEEAFELSDSERGTNGYGSTGTGALSNPVENENSVINNESAPTGSMDSQNIVEVNDPETAPYGSGGEANVPEQAQ